MLAKLKAQLRAHVFEAVQQRDDGAEVAGRAFARTPEGALMTELVSEYLECLGLEYSKRVFDAESGAVRPVVALPHSLEDVRAELRLELREHALAIQGRRERLRESFVRRRRVRSRGKRAKRGDTRGETPAILGPSRRSRLERRSARELGANAREEGKRLRDAPA